MSTLDCAICLERFDSSERSRKAPLSLFCGHSICAECWGSMPSTARMCPFDRTKFPPDYAPKLNFSLLSALEEIEESQKRANPIILPPTATPPPLIDLYSGSPGPGSAAYPTVQPPSPLDPRQGFTHFPTPAPAPDPFTAPYSSAAIPPPAYAGLFASSASYIQRGGVTSGPSDSFSGAVGGPMPPTPSGSLPPYMTSGPALQRSTSFQRPLGRVGVDHYPTDGIVWQVRDCQCTRQRLFCLVFGLLSRF